MNAFSGIALWLWGISMGLSITGEVTSGVIFLSIGWLSFAAGLIWEEDNGS